MYHVIMTIGNEVPLPPPQKKPTVTDRQQKIQNHNNTSFSIVATPTLQTQCQLALCLQKWEVKLFKQENNNVRAGKYCSDSLLLCVVL